MKAIGLFSCLALLATFTYGVEIECSYDSVYWDTGPMYTCRAKIFSTDTPTNVTNIIGPHSAGRNNANVKGFSVTKHQFLTSIPKGIEKFFPNLEAFRWTHGRISTIDSSPFRKFPNLLIINLGHNKLLTLDGHLLQPMRNLRWIYFDNNLLKHVGLGMLTGLTDLIWVDLASNPCIHEWADTPEKIHQLKIQLPIQCPPLTNYECPDTCTIRDAIDDANLEMNTRMEELMPMMDKIEKLENLVLDVEATCSAAFTTTELTRTHTNATATTSMTTNQQD